MSSGVYNIRSKGNLLNCYEFEWDPTKESKLYVIVSCSWISLEFNFLCFMFQIREILAKTLTNHRPLIVPSNISAVTLRLTFVRFQFTDFLQTSDSLCHCFLRPFVRKSLITILDKLRQLRIH